MSRELAGSADGADAARSLRRGVLAIILAAILLGPAIHLLSKPLSAAGWFLVPGAVVMTCLVGWQLRTIDTDVQPTPWLQLSALMALGMALFVVGGQAWLGTLAIAVAFFGRYCRTPVPVVIAAGACVVAGLVTAIVEHFPSGSLLSVLVIAPLAALFAYSAARRIETMDMLRRTRAELARAAVAEERLRIARDLHDLLGHSLSLITLKAELSGRIIRSDPDRAAREIAELESVARQSLSDVREAVAGFRQPDLAGELLAARQLLDAAGIASQISSADTDGLAQEVDAALAWAVREGTTNVVRHSRATQVAIKVTRSQATAIAEISDNGPAAVDDTGQAADAARQLTVGPDGRAAVVSARPTFAGSGLAGLAERVRGLGGELAAGSVQPHGFLLRVVVPLTPQA